LRAKAGSGNPAFSTSSTCLPARDGDRWRQQARCHALAWRQNDRPTTERVGLVFGIALVLTVVAALLEVKQERDGDALITAATEARTLSQQIAKATPLALQGNGAAFKELRETKDRFSAYIMAMQNGGEVEGHSVPRTPEADRQQLDATVAILG